MFPTEGIVYVDGQVLLGKFLATEEEGRTRVVTTGQEKWLGTRPGKTWNVTLESL